MKKIPEWIYPLYKPSDKKVFKLFIDLGKGRKKPKIIGTHKDISAFVKIMIITQILKNYRLYRDMIVKQLKRGHLDLPVLVVQGKKIKIPKGIDRSWVVFTQDKRLCLLVNKLKSKKVIYYGTARDLVEFIARFFLSQLLQDWRGPKMMVLVESLKTSRVSLKKLNKLLGYWDFTRIFNK